MTGFKGKTLNSRGRKKKRGKDKRGRTVGRKVLSGASGLFL